MCSFLVWTFYGTTSDGGNVGGPWDTGVISLGKKRRLFFFFLKKYSIFF